MTRALILAFVFFAPFTSYFAISSWLRLPVVIIILTLILWSIKRLTLSSMRVPNFGRDTEDILLVLFLLVVWTSYLFGNLTSRSLNHALAYSFTILFYVFLFKLVLRDESISSDVLVKVVYWSSIVCFSIILLDFTLVNTVGVGFREHFVSPDSSNMLYFRRTEIISVAGVAEEPAYMAFFLNIIAPLGLLHLGRGRIGKKTIYTLLYVFSLMALTSTAGIVLAVIGAAIIAFWQVLKSFRVSNDLFKVTVILLTISLVTSLMYWKEMSGIIDEVIEKATLSDSSISASLRSESWSHALDDWRSNPIIGNGPGYGKDNYDMGYHGFYFTLLAELGLVGLALIALFIFQIFRRLLRLDATVKYFLLFAFITSTAHFVIVTSYYLPLYWVLIVLCQQLYWEKAKIEE